ncbi:hypothetical protein NDN08_000619 [Rhodosorus marinus]|uniref:Wbp11/ELF5/Saf1 N-terminal domain-containing protein n=1 Tax=Rhodosorus marinus TaxID=101924 RepID=A0AAV8UNH5_9RHOD|nr:hypothetical protein NDN08_000619 [Rhodosorus marinus]
MGKSRDLNPVEKQRREQKEKERRKNKNARAKGREISMLRRDPVAIREEINKLRKDLASRGEDDEKRLVLRRHLKRLQDEFNSAVSAQKKADPMTMERLGARPLPKDFAPANDPLNPENGGESRDFARNRALNRPQPYSNDPMDSYAGPSPEPAPGPSLPAAPVAKPLPKRLVSMVPSSVAKKPKQRESSVIDLAPSVEE